MGNPGNPTEQMPHGDDYLVRRLDNLQRQINELGPSIANSFNTTVAQLQSFVVTGNVNPSGMAIPSSGYSATVPITVPTDMTKCSYTMLVYGSGLNSTGGNSFLGVTILAPSSAVAAAPAASLATAYANTGATGQVTGLTPGSSLNFTAILYATASWAASSANALHIQVLTLFQP